MRHSKGGPEDPKVEGSVAPQLRLRGFLGQIGWISYNCRSTSVSYQMRYKKAREDGRSGGRSASLVGCFVRGQLPLVGRFVLEIIYKICSLAKSKIYIYNYK